MPPRREAPQEEPVALALMAHPNEAMIRKSQHGYFSGEGDDVGKH